MGALLEIYDRIRSFGERAERTDEKPRADGVGTGVRINPVPTGSGRGSGWEFRMGQPTPYGAAVPSRSFAVAFAHSAAERPAVRPKTKVSVMLMPPRRSFP